MKILRILVVLLLCLALAGCGTKLTPEEEYLLTLVQEGNYDMAIQVIENIRLREGGATPAVTAATEVPVETTVETEPPMTERAQLALDTVNRFLEEEGYALMQAFEDTSCKNSGNPQVIHAMEYRLGNCDGNGSSSHLLLVNLQMNVAYDNGIFDNLQLVLDLDTQTFYNSSRFDEAMVLACDGIPTNEEEFNMFAVGSYWSFLTMGNDFLMCDAEICEVLTEAEIAAINSALNP